MKAGVPASILALGLGLLVSPGYAGQQSSQRSNSGRPEQAAATQASPVAAAAQETPPLPSGAATPGAEPSPGETISVDSAMQTQIQDAFDKDPTFSQGGLKVTLVGDGIELTGDVASGRDRQNAARIAQSYARGKKVVNHVVVRGHSTPPGAASPQNPPANLSGPAGTRAASKNSPP